MEIIALQEFLSQYDSRNTIIAYRKDILNFFNFSKKPPEQTDKLSVISYMNELKRSGKSTASISRIFSAIRSYFNFLLSIDTIQKNPILGVKIPRIEHKEKEWLTNDEILKFIKSIPTKTKQGTRDRAIIMLMLMNGLRRSEVCDLNLDSIKKVDDTIVLKIFGKGRKTRIRPLHKQSIRAIKKYIDKNNRNEDEKDSPLFLTRRKRRIQAQDIYRIVKKYLAKSRIKKNIYPHMFRSAFASMELEAGVPITSLQEDLGHSSIETTAMYDASKKSIRRSGVLSIDLPTE